MKNILKRKHILLTLPLISVSLFSVGFSSWAFVNNQTLSENFNVQTNTGTVIDISDCIALNGTISSIKYYGSGFLTTDSNNNYVKSSIGSFYIPLKLTKSDYNYKLNIKIEFVDDANTLGSLNFSTSYVESCKVIDNDFNLIGSAFPTRLASRYFECNFSFNSFVETFNIQFNLKNFDDILFSYLSNSSNYFIFNLTAEIIS